MATKLINEQHLTDIAAAIRYKLGSSDTYLPSEMDDAIRQIKEYDMSGLGAILNGSATGKIKSNITTVRCDLSNNKQLTEIAFPNATTFSYFSISGCEALEKLDLGKAPFQDSTGGYVFSAWQHPNLKTIIVRQDVVEESLLIRFSIIPDDVVFYVPRALVTQYASLYSDYTFRAIEDYPAITG